MPLPLSPERSRGRLRASLATGNTTAGSKVDSSLIICNKLTHNDGTIYFVPFLGTREIFVKMSSIYGFLKLNMEDGDSSDRCLKALSSWNKPYGSSPFDSYGEGGVTLGCSLQHFSEAFPAGPPVIISDNTRAVIDALLYNRKELIEKIGQREGREQAPALHGNAQNLNSLSDETLLMRYIETFGFEALKEVNGDFAGAFYDRDSKTFTLFRDHIGIRPLYYYEDQNIFAFSTDIRGIAAMPDIDLSVDEEMLYLEATGLNSLSPNRTDFSRIRLVYPGGILKVIGVEAGFVLEETVFWKPTKGKIRFPNDRDYHKRLYALVEDAIRVRQEAIPGVLGAELSGGLDSSVIDVFLNRQGREAVYVSWAVSPEEYPIQEADERRLIQDICSQENISCEYLPLEGIVHMDPDMTYPPDINTFAISQTSEYLKRRGVRTVFTGHGGDEGVSHRANPFELWYNKEYGAFLRQLWRSSEGRRFRLISAAKNLLYVIYKGYFEYLRPSRFASAQDSGIMQPDFIGRMKASVKPRPVYFAVDPPKYIRSGGSRYRPETAAYQGSEYDVRYIFPFLDYRVVDYALSIPRYLYLNGGTNRYIYREAFKDIIPRSLYTCMNKDSPVTKPSEDDGNARLMEAFKKNLAELDIDYWQKYMDFGKLNTLAEKENLTENDPDKIVNVMILLGRLYRIQRLQKLT